MKLIKLTKGQYAKVDDWNYEWLNQWKWHAAWNRATQSYYAMRGGNPRRKILKISMARLVSKTPTNLIVDHINRDSLDNQEHNLRNVTYSQNNMNRKVRKDNKTGEKNITEFYVGKRRYYKVRVYANKKLVYQDDFDFIEDAIKSRDREMKKHHGIFSFIR